MGVLTPRSAHALPSAQPPIDINGIFPAHMSFQNHRATHSGRKVCDPEERKKKEEEKIPKIADTSFRCNAQGQHTYFARTKIMIINKMSGNEYKEK